MSYVRTTTTYPAGCCCEADAQAEIRRLKDRVAAIEADLANTTTCPAEPPKPAKTRGEEVAAGRFSASDTEFVIQNDKSWSSAFILKADGAAEVLLDRLLDAYSQDIDAERKAAWNQAITMAENALLTSPERRVCITDVLSGLKK